MSNLIKPSIIIFWAFMFCSKFGFCSGAPTATITGNGYSSVALSATTNVCPNVEYTITFASAAGAQYHLDLDASSTATADWEKNTGSGGSPVLEFFPFPGDECTGTGTGKTGTSKAIKLIFRSAGTFVLLVNDRASSSCSIAGGSVQVNFTFNVLTEAHPVFDPTSVNACLGSDYILDPATDAEGANFASSTKEWYVGSSSGTLIGTATGSTYTLTAADLTSIGANTSQDYTIVTKFSNTIGNGHDNVCVDEATITVTPRAIPVTTAPVASVASMCSNGTLQTITTNCSANCTGTSGTTTYQWGNSNALGVVMTDGGGITKTNTNQLEYSGLVTKLTPGENTYIVTVTGDYGCTVISTSATDILTVNDIPAVEIFHDFAGDATAGTGSSTDGAQICTGKLLTLDALFCEPLTPTPVVTGSDIVPTSNYTTANQTNPNLNTNVDQPNTNSSPLYDEPCNALGFDFNSDLNNYTWKAYQGTSSSGTQLNITSASTHTASTGTGNSVSGVSSIVIGANLAGNVTYELELTAANGCSNSDELVVEMVAPEITFNTDNLASGSTLDACIGETGIQITANCDLCNSINTVNWTSLTSGSNMINGGSGAASGNPVTASTIVSPSGTFNATVVGTDGCTNLSAATIDLNGETTPSVAGLQYAATLCSASPLKFTLTNFNANWTYEIRNGSGGTVLYTCGPNSGGTPCSVSGTTFTAEAIAAQAELLPVAGTNYHIRAIIADCNSGDVAFPSSIEAADA
jgi:hypothetical protein